MFIVLEMDLGGLQRIVNLLIRKMDKETYVPYLCCLDRGGLFYDQFAPNVVRKYVLDRQPGPFDFKMFKRLLGILKDNDVDIIHSHNGCSLYAALAGRLCGVKGIIHTDHGRLVPDRATAILEDRIASLMMDRFVGVSKQLTKYLASAVKVRRGKLITIINGVDTDHFIPLSTEGKERMRRQFGFKTDTMIIGTVCRLDPIKNLNLLIESVPAILRRIPHCQVVIVGDGPDEISLKEKAYRLNLNSEVIFTGRMAEIEKVLPVFDLYVNTSRSEGTSMTILEAMSCGLPVIASAVGGNTNLVDDNSGALFPPDRADLFQESVVSLLGNSKVLEKMGKKSREVVVQQFSFDRVVQQYEAIYSSLVNK